MLNVLAQAINGTESMEQQYLAAIALIDQLESLAGTMMRMDRLSPDVVEDTTRLKQRYIDNFGAENREVVDQVLADAAEARTAAQQNSNDDGSPTNQADNGN